MGFQSWAWGGGAFLPPHPGLSPARRTRDANLLLTFWLHLKPEERNVSLLLRSQLEELLGTSVGVEKLQLVSLFVEGGCFTFLWCKPLFFAKPDSTYSTYFPHYRCERVQSWGRAMRGGGRVLQRCGHVSLSLQKGL